MFLLEFKNISLNPYHHSRVVERNIRVTLVLIQLGVLKRINKKVKTKHFYALARFWATKRAPSSNPATLKMNMEF